MEVGQSVPRDVLLQYIVDTDSAVQYVHMIVLRTPSIVDGSADGQSRCWTQTRAGLVKDTVIY